MGQDKKQLEHLLNFVKAVYSDPDNKEFVDGIQSMIKNDLQEDKTSWTGKIDEIYELCLSKNLREQAEDFYKNIPLQTIKQTLVERYIEMEEARRKGNFDDFGRCLFLQLECMVNTLVKDKELCEIYQNMIYAPSTLDTSDWQNLSVDKRYPHARPIWKILFGSEANKGKSLEKLSTTDRLIVVYYFICHQAMLVNSELAQFTTDKFLYIDIYTIRNHDSHEGSVPTEWQKERYETVHKNEGQSYLRFTSALLTFVEGIEKGYPIDSKLIQYARTI